MSTRYAFHTSDKNLNHLLCIRFNQVLRFEYSLCVTLHLMGNLLCFVWLALWETLPNEPEPNKIMYSVEKKENIEVEIFVAAFILLKHKMKSSHFQTFITFHFLHCSKLVKCTVRSQLTSLLAIQRTNSKRFSFSHT